MNKLRNLNNTEQKIQVSFFLTILAKSNSRGGGLLSSKEKFAGLNGSKTFQKLNKHSVVNPCPVFQVIFVPTCLFTQSLIFEIFTLFSRLKFRPIKTC